MKFIIYLMMFVTANLCVAGKTKQPPVQPPSYALWNVDTGHMLVSQDSDTVRPMASITKLMTVLVTLQSDLNLDELVTVVGKEGSSKIRAGQTLTRRELIDLALVASDNLAARTLSETSGRSYDEFITIMNLTASNLNMKNTSYSDSTGLLALNVSTPEDLKLLVQATEHYPVFKQNAMSPTTTVGVWAKNKLKQVTANNTNSFAGKLDLIGAKTGYTSKAGRCLTMFFQDHGQRYVLVVLGASTPEQRRKMVNKLIDIVQG